ncbi:histidine phosphatase family protein [Coleofasciculus sp. F4-SAH-05]
MAKLILVRHGQSMWNAANRFTGWVDVPLSRKFPKSDHDPPQAQG